MDDDLDFEPVMLTRRALRLLKAEVWDEGWDARDAQKYQTSNPYDQ